MRKLTWKEQLIDASYDGAITKWCAAVEKAIAIAPPKVYMIEIVAVDDPHESSSEIYEDVEDNPGYIIVRLSAPLPIPDFCSSWELVFEKLLRENGFVACINKRLKCLSLHAF